MGVHKSLEWGSADIWPLAIAGYKASCHSTLLLWGSLKGLMLQGSSRTGLLSLFSHRLEANFRIKAFKSQL